MSGKTGRHQIPIPTGTKQGIVTILGADGERNENRSAAASIRRTLSADMSSRKWLHQNGFFFSPSPRKTKFPLSSSSSFSSSSSSNNEDGEEFYHNPSHDEVWRSIQSSNNRAREMAKVEPCGSILSQKSESSLLPPPYVHPLVKRSFSSMREESLDICTESLGSETGSDCYFPSKCSIECPNKIYNYENETQKEYRYDRDPYTNLRVAKYKSVPARPFPPTAGGAHIRLQPRREDGRLILEAIPVSPRNNFRAIREGGRLVLTLVGVGERTTTEERVEGVFYYDVEDVPQADDNEEKGLVVENSMSFSGVMMGLPEKMFVMKKFVTMANVSAAWAYKKEEEILVPQSLPQEPRVERLIPPAAGVASLNVYEYFWKNTTASFGGLIHSAPGISLTNSIISVKNKISSNNNNSKICENRDLVLKEGKKGEHLVPYLRGCKEGPRRSLLNWEPYCIATS